MGGDEVIVFFRAGRARYYNYVAARIIRVARLG